MNIDFEIANRALSRAGQAAIIQGDSTSKSFLLIKKFYLSTMLESLAEIPWTSAKKRIELVAPVEAENFTAYAFVYDLPIDCAKPLELQENDYFIVEGRHLYSDRPAAVLLYITNGKVDTPMFGEDYQDYDPPQFEDKFYEYLETKTASKLVLELSGKSDLYQLLYNEAALIGAAASTNSKASSAAKRNGQDWWMNQIRS